MVHHCELGQQKIKIQAELSYFGHLRQRVILRSHGAKDLKLHWAVQTMLLNRLHVLCSEYFVKMITKTTGSRGTGEIVFQRQTLTKIYRSQSQRLGFTISKSGVANIVNSVGCRRNHKSVSLPSPAKKQPCKVATKATIRLVDLMTQKENPKSQR